MHKLFGKANTRF